jgi:hypothetical protein
MEGGVASRGRRCLLVWKESWHLATERCLTCQSKGTNVLTRTRLSFFVFKFYFIIIKILNCISAKSTITKKLGWKHEKHLGALVKEILLLRVIWSFSCALKINKKKQANSSESPKLMLILQTHNPMKF